MPVTTSRIDVAGSWAELATGSLDVLVQLQTVGSVEIVVAEAQPAADAAQTGVILHERGETVFSITGLTATDNVYARVPSGDTETLTVIKSPTQTA